MNRLLFFLVLINAYAFVVKCEDEEDFERPCGSDAPLNVECVRDFFEQNAKCSVVSDPNDDEPIVRAGNTYFVPMINVTIIDGENYLKNHNGTIQELFINPNTQQAVMTVLFKDTFLDSPAATVYVGRLGREPLVITETMNGTYPNYFLTAVLSLNDGRITPNSVQQGTVYTHFGEGEAVLLHGPKVMESDNPIVQEGLATLAANRDTAVKEIFLTEGHSRWVAYTQKYICDFDVSTST